MHQLNLGAKFCPQNLDHVKMGTDVECLLLVATFIGADDFAGVPRQPACGKPVCQDAGRIRNGLKNGGGIARPMLSCQIRLQRFGILSYA